MGTYSIKELEIITGIKAHTIRIWEQRYNIVDPSRTGTNIRYYSEDDLKRLLNISVLNKSGMKISRIARLSDKDMRERVMELSESNFEYDNQINGLVVAMIDFDEASFEKIISTNILRIGFESTFLNIVFPFLQNIGVLWQTAVIRPAQEHFMSNLIRQKILVAIDGQVIPKNNGAKKYMLFLPEKELHELSLLYMNYVIRSQRKHSLYLGASVPYEDIDAACKDYQPDYICTICISYPAESTMQEFIDKLAGLCPDTTIMLSGRQALAVPIKLPANVALMRSMQESIDFVKAN